MEFNSVEGWSIYVCVNTTIFLLGTKVSFVLQHIAFLFIFREVNSVCLYHMRYVSAGELDFCP